MFVYVEWCVFAQIKLSRRTQTKQGALTGWEGTGRGLQNTVLTYGPAFNHLKHLEPSMDSELVVEPSLL